MVEIKSQYLVAIGIIALAGFAFLMLDNYGKGLQLQEIQGDKLRLEHDQNIAALARLNTLAALQQQIDSAGIATISFPDGNVLQFTNPDRVFTEIASAAKRNGIVTIAGKDSNTVLYEEEYLLALLEQQKREK